MEYIRESWLDMLALTDDWMTTEGKEFTMANIECSVNDSVTVELYGKVIPGKVVATHNPGDGYGQSVEVELSEAWRGAKKLWFEAKDVKPSRGLSVGDTVRIVGEEYRGQVGELRVIDPDADEGDYFGVHLDSVGHEVFFRADEIEKVSPEQALFDEAYARAVALGRTFEDVEVFGPIWEQGIELVPQMDSRFVLHREATKRTRRLWSVVDMAELPF